MVSSSSCSGPPEALCLDVVIPVYNEGPSIGRTLDALLRHVRSPFRVLIAYDFDEDDTLPVVAERVGAGLRAVLVKNQGRGALGAVVTALNASSAPAVLVLPADDDYNAQRVDAMLELFRQGCDVVCASRFSPGSRVTGYPLRKRCLVRSASWVLEHVARLPTRDATNGLRLFASSLVKAVPIESKAGHAYSLELLVKCHRLRGKIGEVPVEWHEREAGKSRFLVLRWLPAYLRWFGYALGTTLLGRGPSSVRTLITQPE